MDRFTLEDISGDPEIRIIIEGGTDGEATITVEIGLGRDWIARHQIARQNGVWMVLAAHEFVPRSDAHEPLTARLKRRATVHPHLPRIEGLLDDALKLDVMLDFETTPWWYRLVLDWGISRLRSPRGRAPKISPQEVEDLRKEGLPDRQIAVLLGVHPKSISRARKRALGREL